MMLTRRPAIRRAEIVHRDIKPDNLMIGEDEIIKSAIWD